MNGTIKVSESGLSKIIKRRVRLAGMTDIMFDRYPGDNRTQLETWQKLYLTKENKICLPATNLMSALSAENTNSWPRILLDKRKYKDFARAVLSYTSFSPHQILFTRNGAPIILNSQLENDLDADTGIYVHRTVARLEKGIPNPKVRPVLPAPWELEFDLTIIPNQAFQEQELRNIFAQGGVACGLGTFRGVFGKFLIEKWE